MNNEELNNIIESRLKDSIYIKQKAVEYNIINIITVSQAIVNTLNNNKKIMICGNGGSAADSQHIAGEFVGRFLENRKALRAIALTTDTSILTALGNDFGFEIIFNRQVEALGEKDDILIGISTGGNSKNVINAFKLANEMGIKTISFTGQDGGELKKISFININVESNSTPRIQETHTFIYHMISELVEKEFCSE